MTDLEIIKIQSGYYRDTTDVAMQDIIKAAKRMAARIEMLENVTGELVEKNAKSIIRIEELEKETELMDFLQEEIKELRQYCADGDATIRDLRSELEYEKNL